MDKMRADARIHMPEPLTIWLTTALRLAEELTEEELRRAFGGFDLGTTPCYAGCADDRDA